MSKKWADEARPRDQPVLTWGMHQLMGLYRFSLPAARTRAEAFWRAQEYRSSGGEHSSRPLPRVCGGGGEVHRHSTEPPRLPIRF